MTRRTYSEQAVDEHIEREQLARAARATEQRSGSPEWRLVLAEDGLPGLIWEQVKGND